MSFEKWETAKMEEICSYITDGKHGDCNPQEGSGYYFLSVKDIFDGRLNYENARQITKEDFLETHKRTRLEPGDILCTNSGTIGRLAIAKDSILTHKTTFQKSVAILKPLLEKVDSSFLYYSLLSRRYDIEEASGGTTQKNLLLRDLRAFTINLPPLATQRRIAALLTALDDKIELNRRMNETLEGLAGAVWGEWFGRYAGGEELPEGWRWGKVGDVCSVNKNSLSKNDSIEWIDYIEISEVNRGKIGNITRYERGTEPSRARRKIKHGDIVLSTVRPDRGAFFLAQFPDETTIVSTGFAVFTAEKVPFGFLYIYLTQDEMLDFYGQMADGGAYPAINPSVILEKEFVIPDDQTLADFQNLVEPIFERIHQNSNQSRTLTALRDALLPRLMSGALEL